MFHGMQGCMLRDEESFGAVDAGSSIHRGRCNGSNMFTAKSKVTNLHKLMMPVQTFQHLMKSPLEG